MPLVDEDKTLASLRRAVSELDTGTVRKANLISTKNKFMKSIFVWFRQRFKKGYRPDPCMQLMLHTLAITEEPEISCEDVFAVLDQFAEAVHRGENVLLFMPLVRKRLDVCPACREEYETLLNMLQPTID